MGCNGSKDDKLPQLLLPQQRTVEQQRKDIADRDETRAKYEWKYDEPQPLPPKLAKVPASEIPLQNMKDFILIFARINISKVLEWTNLLDHWVKEHKTAGPWDKFHAIFEPLSLYPPPSIAKDWQTDDAFCRSRTNGLYPWFLTKADLKAHDFPVTDALLGDLIKGHTLESLGNEGRLFTCSFPQLVGVTPREGAVIAAPIELHWVNDDGFLRPLAIQLGQKSTDSPIFTPNDPPNLWLAVKMHANAAITICHTYNIHAVEMHWVSETIWLALIRNLAADHPLRVFFAPHYRVLFFVNEQFRMQFNDSAVASFIYMETSAPKGHWELMSNGYKGWTFDRLNIVKQYEKRGLHHLKKETYYRDDSTTIWHTHNKLCRGLVESVYKTDKDVQEDFQLQAWLEELASPIGGNMQGLPVDANGKMSTREQLIEMTTCMFFDVTHKHSFLEAAKLDYFGFAPYNPDTFKLPIPQTKDEISIETIVEALPPNKEAVLAGALMHNGGTAPPDFKLTNLPKGYLAGAPEGVEKAVETWKEDLNKVEEQMQKRNKEAGVNYTYCLPSVSANQIHN